MTLNKLRMKSVCILVLCTFVMNLLASCGGGGGSGGGGVGGESTSGKIVSAQLLSTSDTNTYTSNQVAVIRLTNYSLANNTYEAMINNTKITLSRTSESTLAFLFPNLSNGNYDIEVKIGGNNYKLPVVVSNVIITDSFDAVVTKMSTQLDTNINDLILQYSNIAGSESLVSTLQKLSLDLKNAANQVSTLTNIEKQQLKEFIYNNILQKNNVLKQVIPKSTSKSLNRNITVSNTIYDFAKLVASVSALLIAIPTAVAGPVGLIAVGGVFVMVCISVRDCVDDLAYFSALSVANNATFLTFLTLYQKSKEALEATSNPTPKRTIKSTNSLTPSIEFHDNISRSFKIKSSYIIKDQALSSNIDSANSAISTFNSMLSVITNFVSSATPFDKFDKTINDQDSPANTYSVKSISNNNIQSDVVIGSDLQLTFKFVNPPSSSTPVPFTFTLVDSRDNHTTTVSATLSTELLVPDPSVFPVNLQINDTWWDNGAKGSWDWVVTDIYDYASWIGLDSSKAFQACSNNCYSGSASKSIPGSSPDYQDFQYNAKISKGVLTLTTTGRRNGVNPSVVNTWSWATVTSYSSYANLTLTYNVNTGAFSMIADHNQYVGIISNGVPSIRSMTGDGRLSGTWPLVVFSP